MPYPMTSFVPNWVLLIFFQSDIMSPHPERILVIIDTKQTNVHHYQMHQTTLLLLFLCHYRPTHNSLMYITTRCIRQLYYYYFDDFGRHLNLDIFPNTCILKTVIKMINPFKGDRKSPLKSRSVKHTSL